MLLYSTEQHQIQHPMWKRKHIRLPQAYKAILLGHLPGHTYCTSIRCRFHTKCIPHYVFSRIPYISRKGITTNDFGKPSITHAVRMHTYTYKQNSTTNRSMSTNAITSQVNIELSTYNKILTEDQISMKALSHWCFWGLLVYEIGRAHV